MPESIYEFGFVDDYGPEITWTNCPPGVIKGPFRHPLGLYEHTGSGSGVPLEPETPALLIDQTTSKRAPMDFEVGAAERWYISARAKEVFDRLDFGAFDFRRAEVMLRTATGQVPGPDYYICDVVRFLDALDESRSRVSVAPGSMRVVSFFFDDNVFNARAIGDHRVFRLMYSPHRILCTEAFRTGVRQAGLTNITFTKIGVLDAD